MFSHVVSVGFVLGTWPFDSSINIVANWSPRDLRDVPRTCPTVPGSFVSQVPPTAAGTSMLYNSLYFCSLGKYNKVSKNILS